MNDLESGGSRTAVTRLPADSSRGQPHTSATMDVGLDSQQVHWAPAGQPPTSRFIRPSQPASQLALVQPMPPQPNLNQHISAPQPVPPPPIPPYIVPPQVIPPHDIPPQPTSQAQPDAIAQPIPAQPNASQPQQSTVLPFRFDLQEPPLPYIFGSAVNHQNANTSEMVLNPRKRNRPVNEDPAKIRVIRHHSVSIKTSVFYCC